MYFKIALAGVTVGICSIYDDVFRMCRDYISYDDPSFTVAVTDGDIEFERERSAREAMLEHRKTADHSDSYLETLAVYRKIAVGMLDHNVCLIHGSAVACGDEAFLFTAPSGTGKTTHTSLWLDNIPGAYVVNGDKPLLRADDGGCLVCGTPWAGKEGWNANSAVPLSAICFLERGEKNRIEEISFRDVYPELFAQIYRPAEREDVEKTMDIIKEITKNVRFYRLACNMDPEAATVAYNGMKKK